MRDNRQIYCSFEINSLDDILGSIGDNITDIQILDKTN